MNRDGRYGDARLQAHADAIMDNLDAFRPQHSIEELSRPQDITDDFAAAGVNSKADIRAAYAGNFYFGCEADDPATMWGCSRRPLPEGEAVTPSTSSPEAGKAKIRSSSP